MQGLRQQIEELNRSSVGTPLEEVLAPADVTFCREFLDFMAQRQFPGVQTISRGGGQRHLVPNEPEDHGEYEAFQGYNIGLTRFYEGRFKERAIYLCTDGRLRVTIYRTTALLGSMPRILSQDGTNAPHAPFQNYGKYVPRVDREWVPPKRIPKQVIPGHWETVESRSWAPMANVESVTEHEVWVRRRTIPAETIPGYYAEHHRLGIEEVPLREQLMVIVSEHAT